MDRYIIHCAVTVQKQESRQRKQKQNKAHKNKQQTKQQKTRQHGWWSADQFIVLAMYKKDDSFVSPRDWYGRGKTKQQTKKDHNYAIQKSVSQESTKAQCGNQGSPQEPRDHKVQPHGQHSHRLLDMIPKPVMTQSYGTSERGNRGSET